MSDIDYNENEMETESDEKVFNIAVLKEMSIGERSPASPRTSASCVSGMRKQELIFQISRRRPRRAV